MREKERPKEKLRDCVLLSAIFIFTFINSLKFWLERTLLVYSVRVQKELNCRQSAQMSLIDIHIVLWILAYIYYARIKLFSNKPAGYEQFIYCVLFQWTHRNW